MYLMDPDMGQKRRKYLKAQAGGYLEGTCEMLGSRWEAISDKAREWGGAFADTAEGCGTRIVEQAKDVGSSWRDKASSSASDLADNTRGWLGRGGKWLSHYTSKAREYVPSARQIKRDLRDHGKEMWSRARSTARRTSGEESTPVMPIVLTAIGCCALGAGLMYVIDPQRGRSRRAWLRDKTRSFFRRTGRSMYHGGKDLANRAYGTMHEAGKFWQGSDSSSNLEQRVRSQLGRMTSRPRLVEVMCDDNGSVTLSGYVLDREAASLISNLESIPGVNIVISRLESLGSLEDLDRRAGSRSQGVPQM
jgi:hypothetical protein